MSQNPSTPTRDWPPNRTWTPWLVPALISAVGISLCYWIWARTGEIVLDFGGELYTAWQLSTGKVLYRDVACIYGPLSPNLNAAVMRLCGPGLIPILITNLLILILATSLLYWLVKTLAGTFTAAVASIFFLCIFALSAPTRLTNYNFLTPYAHEMTQGFLLCLATLGCVDWFHRKGSMRAVLFGGLATGLAFLTKPEIFLGCFATYLLGLGACFWLSRPQRPIAKLVAGITAILIPPAIALSIYSSRMAIHPAIDGVLGGWQLVGKPFIVAMPFYRGSLGADDLLNNSLRMLEYAGFYAAAGIVLALLGQIAAKLPGKRPTVPIVAGFILAFACYSFLTSVGDAFDSFWPDAARGMPLFAAFVVVLSALRIKSARDDSSDARPAIVQWSLAILSLVFLAKIVLDARMFQYGFVLAAPCGMLGVVALIRWLPDWVQRRGGSGVVVRLAACGILVAFVAHYLILTQNVLQERTLPIPLKFGGVVWARPSESLASADAIKWLATTSATAAVIPDAAGINYAAGRPCPVPFIATHPMAMAIFDESNVVNAFDRNPPKYILLMDFNEQAMGARAFGQDYGLQLSSWITAHYRQIGVFTGDDHPILLWTLKKPPSR